MVDFTNADVRKGKLTVNTGGEDFTVNVSVPVNVFVRNSGDGVVNLGSSNDIVQDYGSGDVTFNLGAGADQFFAGKGVTGHLIVNGGAGNDVLIDASKTSIDFLYTFVAGQSGDGADGIKGFTVGEDHLVLQGITLQQFAASFAVTDAPGSLGVVITDGTADGWSVQLLGVHETKAQLLADDAFVFA